MPTNILDDREAEDAKACLCCRHHVPKRGPRACPLCHRRFEGSGWDGVDAHWRASHEDSMPYEEFWASLCSDHRGTGHGHGLGGNAAPDPLLETVQAVVAQTKADGMPIFYGFSSEQTQDDFTWDQEQGGGSKEFLACARKANASLIYLAWMVFDQDQLEDVDDDEDNDVEDGLDLSEFEQYVGRVGSFDLVFVADGVRHVYREVADWFAEFCALTDTGEDEDDEENGEPVDSALVEEWARSLAADPGYGRCKNYGAKRYLLNRLAGDEIGELPVEHILDQAEVIWEVEAGPQEEQRLRDAIRDLKAQGLTIAAIAQRLAISRYRVSGLIDS